MRPVVLPEAVKKLKFLCNLNRVLMSSSTVNSGTLVLLEELNPSSPFFRHGASVRVTGKLQEYVFETAVAVIADGSSTLRVDAQFLNLNFRAGSIYQFIGELHVPHGSDQVSGLNEEFGMRSNGITMSPPHAVLKARVGRNVDGMDLGLYRQSLQLLRDFQAKHAK